MSNKKKHTREKERGLLHPQCSSSSSRPQRNPCIHIYTGLAGISKLQGAASAKGFSFPFFSPAVGGSDTAQTTPCGTAGNRFSSLAPSRGCTLYVLLSLSAAAAALKCRPQIYNISNAPLRIVSCAFVYTVRVIMFPVCCSHFSLSLSLSCAHACTTCRDGIYIYYIHTTNVFR